MKRIIVDAETARRLLQLGRSVELCDDAGNTLGRFEPLVDVIDWEKLEPDSDAPPDSSLPKAPK